MTKLPPLPVDHPDRPVGAQSPPAGSARDDQAHEPDDGPLTPEQLERIRLLAAAQMGPTGRVISSLLNAKWLI